MMEEAVDHSVSRPPPVSDGMEEMQSKDLAGKIKFGVEEQRLLVSEDVKESLAVFPDVEDNHDKTSNIEGEQILVSENLGLMNGSYSCPTCRKTFKRKVNLRAHLGTHVTSKIFECSKCEKKFHQEHLLSYHMASHTSGRYKCFKCGKRYRYKRNLIVHERAHERGKQVECSESGKDFSKVRDLMHHVNVYMNWPFKCIYCSRGFDNQEDCNKHVATHNVETPFECVLCSAKFSCKESLQHHDVTHYIENLFRCKQCRKVFKTKHSLDRHIVSHSVKLISCEVCGKFFDRTDSLRSHMMTHGIMKPFHCPKCKKTLEHKSTVKVHLISRSSDEVCSCHVCECEFNGEEQKQATDHIPFSEKLSCEIPQSLQLFKKGKNQLAKLNKNEKQHLCHTCGKTYPERQSLIDHMAVHLQCTKCKKVFKTKEALDMHLLLLGSEKLLSCCLCGNILHGKRELHHHLKEHIRAKRHYFSNSSKADGNKKGLKLTAKSREDSNESFSLVKATSQEAGVKIHVVTHAGKNSLKCSECGRKVHLRHNLEEHLKSNKKDQTLQPPQSGEEFVYISRFGHPMLDRRELPESYCKCNHNIRNLLKDYSEDPPKTDMIPCQGFGGCVGNKKVSECVVKAISCSQNANSLPKTTVRCNTEMLNQPNKKTKLDLEIMNRIDGIKIEVPDTDVVIKEEWDVP